MKKDGSVKLALESRELSKQVHKNIYQLPDIEELMDAVGQTIGERKPGDVYFYTFLQWTLRMRKVNYHLVRKQASNAIFCLWEENYWARIVFERGFTAHNHASGIPKSNGNNPLGISTGTRIH